MGLLFIFYMTGLWFYSYKLKSTFLLGNLLIAVFLGLVPLASAYIEVQADVRSRELINSFIVIPVRTGAWLIAGFAFLSALTREIVKDMEDMEGDRLAGCRTMPVVWGIKKCRILVLVLVVFLIGSAGAFQYYAWFAGWHPSFYYVMIFIQIPCLVIIWKIWKAQSAKEFHGASTWLKILMVSGICYLFVFAYESYLTLQFIHKLSNLL